MAQNLGYPVPPSQDLPSKREGGSHDEQLHELSSGFAPFPDPNLSLHQRLRELAEEVRSIAGRGGCVVGLLEGDDFICRASVGEGAPGLGSRIQIHDDFFVECIRSRRAQVCQDTRSDPRVDALACRAAGVRSVMIVPLLAQNEEKLIGILEASSPDSHAFGVGVTERMEIVGHRIVELLTPAQDHGEAQVTAVADSDLPEANMEKLTEQKLEARSVPISVSATQSQSEQRPEPVSNAAAALPNASSAIGDLAPPILAAKIPPAPAFQAGSASAPLRKSPPNRMLAYSVLGAVIVLAGLIVWVEQEKSRQENSASAKATPVPSASPASSAIGIREVSAASYQTQRNSASKPEAAVGPQPTRSANKPAGSKLLGRKSGTPKDSQAQSGDLVVYEKGKVIYRDGQAVGSRVNASDGPRASSMIAAAQTERLEETVNAPERSAEDQNSAFEAGIIGGTLLHRVLPAYPPEALAARLEGDVVLEGVIGKDGAVREAHVVTGDARFVEAALEAVRHWRYDPFRSKGQPVDMLSTLTVRFRLPRASNQ